MLNATVGHDLELLVRNAEGDVIPAEMILPRPGLGEERASIKLSEVPACVEHRMGKLIKDGFSLELNPGWNSCREYLAYTTWGLLKAAKRLADAAECTLDPSPVGDVKLSTVMGASKNCQVFGCSPDINVYNMKEDHPIVDAKKHLRRYAGGHIHIGMETHHRDKYGEEIVKCWDYIVGNTSILFDNDPLNKVRRAMYGQAGRFRFQPHGLEYRTLSNFWIKSPSLLSLFIGLARGTCDMVYAGEVSSALLGKLVSPDDIRCAIDTVDVDLAMRNFLKIRKYIRMFSITSTGTDESMLDRILLTIIFQGVEDKLHLKNWLEDEWHISRMASSVGETVVPGFFNRIGRATLRTSKAKVAF